MKTSVEVPDELMNKVKEYNLTHKSRPINMSGAFQETLERIIEEITKPNKIIKNPIDPEIITDSSLSLEAMRQKWWEDKQIGKSIINAGGIGVINLTNIIQKNPDLFETKEECRSWLHNKLKTEPPVIEIETPIIPNKQRKRPALNTTEEEALKFMPNRTTTKRPGCGEEHLIIPGSSAKRCANCGNPEQENSTKPQPDQQAQEQDTPTPPPVEAEP